MAGRPLAVVRLFLRFLLIAAILAYFAAAAGLLATRYWLLPRIDQWRPEIEQTLSRAVGTPVRFDSIQADWRGLNANLKLTNLRILDEAGVAQLGVPTTDVIVSWRSLLALEPVFRYIGVDDVVLVARRTPDGQTYVAGFEVDSNDQDQNNFWQSETVRWLLKQGRINIEDSRLVWVDQQRKALPLVFEDIDITLDNGLLGHKLALKLKLPKQWGGTLDVLADIDALHSSLSRLLLDEPDGYLYAQVSELYPQAMHPWLDLPKVKGSFAGRLWLDVLDGKLSNFTMSLAGRDTTFRPTELSDNTFSIEQFRWQASGPLALLGADVQFPNLIESKKLRQRLSSSVSLENAVFEAPVAGMQAIVADQLTAEVALSRPTADGLQIDVQDMAFANDDGLVTARGSWALDDEGKGGRLDLQGTLARFKLPSLHQYLPDTIGEDAHQWLSSAFKSGMVPRASFEIAGLVDDFPFSPGRGPGTFRIDGSVQDWSVDYLANNSADELPWPPLADMNGALTMVNDRIAVDIATGSLSLPKGERINLSALTAELTDLEGDVLLTVKGQTNGKADDYLGLFKYTALRDIAPEFVRDFTGAGNWDMPLVLRVPLDDVDKTTFTGELSFNGGSVAYASSPQLTELAGVALLSETGFEAKDLAATLLGGRVALSGGINDKLNTMSGKGELAWAELAEFAGSQIVDDWFKGKMAYDFSATVKDDKFDVVLSSDLAGTRIVLPAPLGLSTGQSAQTKLQLKGDVSGAKPEQWELSLANRVLFNGTSVLKGGNGNAPFFRSVNLAIGSAKPLPGAGLTVSGQLPSIALEDWMPAIDTITSGLDKHSPAGPPVFPPLSSARLQTKQFVMGANRLENVTADLTVKNGRQYHVKLASSQTDGTVQWAVDRGALQDGYFVRLDRLEIGNHDKGHDSSAKPAGHDRSTLPDPGALSNLPALDIEIKDMTLYGSRLGEFKLMGRNTENRQQWEITKLQIINPHAELTASGSCRFNADPGMMLDAELKIADLGELTKFLGHGEQVRKGKGTLKADIQWSRFPWHFDYEGLSGKAELKLEEGVFDHINSSSARVLELLSMQSLNRILSANINPDETFEKGFPWNAIDGAFEIRKGVVGTKNLTVTSPVATISLTGNSSLVDETWDLEAVVRPNLDMSGTALATGFLVNPIVGLSALVGQYLLRNPVESALSQRYRVTGPWDDPKINENSPSDKKAEQKNQPPELGN